jgi:hypothetical protein
MEYTVVVHEDIGLVLVNRDNIEIVKLIKFADGKLVIRYCFDDISKLTISMYKNVVISDINNPREVTFKEDNLKQNYLNIFLDARATIGPRSYFSHLRILNGEELKQFKYCIDLLEKIYEIYINTQDIEAVKQFLCNHSNTKSARN